MHLSLFSVLSPRPRALRHSDMSAGRSPSQQPVIERPSILEYCMLLVHRVARVLPPPATVHVRDSNSSDDRMSIGALLAARPLF